MNARYALARVAAATLVAAVAATLLAASLTDYKAHAADQARQVPYIGATVADISGEDCRKSGISERVRGGVIITGIDPGGPADRKGLREGDIITELERKPVTSAWQFYGRIHEMSVGVLAQLHVWRDGRDRMMDLVQLEGVDAGTPISGGIADPELGNRIDRLEREIVSLKKRVATLERGSATAR
jgi:S1-C subfamily serine protease